MPRGLTILCAAKLHANQLERHLELFEYIDEIERVLVVRHGKVPERLSKIENHTFDPGSRPTEALRMVRNVGRLIESQNVDWVIGFNPVPWGTLALTAARRTKTPTCLSLIGMDFIQVQKWWGRPFLEAVRRADAVTVTGEKMVRGLVNLGVAEDKIRILPHSVDLDRFNPSGDTKPYDIVCVGQLIERKRMDVLIDAVAIQKERGMALRVAILGTGPLENRLADQVSRLGIDDLVDFLGYRDDVERVLARGRVFCLPSEWEGVPFAMMEAMASGLVPVVTDVGTIADWIRPGINGHIVPVGDPAALAKALARLFENGSAELEAIRRRIIAERQRLGFLAGADVWREIFGLRDRP